MLGYVGKKPDGTYAPFHWKSSVALQDVEISDDMFIIQKETAEAYVAAQKGPTPPPVEPPVKGKPPGVQPPTTPPPVTPPPTTVYTCVRWSGDVPPQKWMNFYTKVLSKFVTQNGLKIRLDVEIAPPGGVSAQKVDEIRVALRELGLSDEVASDTT
jgi:hypothetical protein